MKLKKLSICLIGLALALFLALVVLVVLERVGVSYAPVLMSNTTIMTVITLVVVLALLVAAALLTAKARGSRKSVADVWLYLAILFSVVFIFLGILLALYLFNVRPAFIESFAALLNPLLLLGASILHVSKLVVAIIGAALILVLAEVFFVLAIKYSKEPKAKEVCECKEETCTCCAGKEEECACKEEEALSEKQEEPKEEVVPASEEPKEEATQSEEQKPAQEQPSEAEEKEEQVEAKSSKKSAKIKEKYADDDVEHEVEALPSDKDYSKYNYVLHVIRYLNEENEKADRWKVKIDGSAKIVQFYSTQVLAIKAARELAKEYNCKVIIHKVDGQIRKR